MLLTSTNGLFLYPAQGTLIFAGSAANFTADC